MYKVVVFVPKQNADTVREAIGESGGGKIGLYSHCSFSGTGYGRYKPLAGSHPAIGSVGEYETVEEERIEFICEKSNIKKVLTAIKKVHPYEEVAVDIYQLVSERDF